MMVVFTQAPGVGPATGPPAGAPVDAASLVVEARGDCPSGPAVTAALLPVLGVVSVPGNAGPRVSDLGDRFEASAAGQTGLYVDTARDCAERARVAAVFIALALNPPTFQSGGGPPPPRPKPVGHRWFQAGAAVRLDAGAMGNAPPRTVTPWGGELSVAAGYGGLGGALSAGVLDGAVAQFSRFNPTIAVRQQRFPLSAALLFQHDLPWHLRVGAELGASFVLVTFRAEDLQSTSTVLRLDAGLRAALNLRLPPLSRHFAPFVEVHGEYFPKPYKLDVDPVGTVGSSGRFWLGASAGVQFETL